MWRWVVVWVIVVLCGAALGGPRKPGPGDEMFAQGMTVAFAGTRGHRFRVKVETPMPVERLSSSTDKRGHMVPLDLWVLDTEGARLAADKARLTDPTGRVVAPRKPGHWRVERPEGGRWKLDVPALGRPWRLWSAFHPFLVSLDGGLPLKVGKTGALFLATVDKRPFELHLKPVDGAVDGSVRDTTGGKPIAGNRLLRADGPPGAWRVDLGGPGTVELKLRDATPWAAFTPWDVFPPGAPTVRIEGNPRPKPRQPLDLRAVVTDPENDVAGITWLLPGGQKVHGARLRVPVPWFAAFPLRVVARDRKGTTGAAEIEVCPPPPHERRTPDMVFAQAESFTAQGNGKVLVTNRGHNDGKMITLWHRGRNHWLEWQVKLPRAGLYEIFARYASNATPRRKLLIDGAVPSKAYEEFALPGTGGFGLRAPQWRVAQLGPPVRLAAGLHRLRLINEHGQKRDGMALDYLVLRPLAAAKEARP